MNHTFTSISLLSLSHSMVMQNRLLSLKHCMLSLMNPTFGNT